VQRLRHEARGNSRAQGASWVEIVRALEQVKGEDWSSFVNRPGRCSVAGAASGAPG